MTHATLAATLALAAAMTMGGTLIGLAYFACLRRTVELFVGRSDWARPALLTLMRLAGVTAALALAAQGGAVALLAGFGGFLIARTLSLRQARSGF